MNAHDFIANSLFFLKAVILSFFSRMEELSSVRKSTKLEEQKRQRLDNSQARFLLIDFEHEAAVLILWLRKNFNLGAKYIHHN